VAADRVDDKVTCWECILWAGGTSCEIRDERKWSPIYGYAFCQSDCRDLNPDGNCKHYEPKPKDAADKIIDTVKAIKGWFMK